MTQQARTDFLATGTSPIRKVEWVGRAKEASFSTDVWHAQSFAISSLQLNRETSRSHCGCFCNLFWYLPFQSAWLTWSKAAILLCIKLQRSCHDHNERCTHRRWISFHRNQSSLHNLIQYPMWFTSGNKNINPRYANAWKKVPDAQIHPW